ncbi:MAG: hypothetical protein AAFY11_01215 [Cyanobacteria bacterium J06641_5]
MKPFDPEWSIFSEETGSFNRKQRWGYQQPRHVLMPPGQRCPANRSQSIAAPEFVERIRRDRVRTQLAQQLGSGPAPALA